MLEWVYCKETVTFSNNKVIPRTKNKNIKSVLYCKEHSCAEGQVLNPPSMNSNLCQTIPCY